MAVLLMVAVACPPPSEVLASPQVTCAICARERRSGGSPDPARLSESRQAEAAESLAAASRNPIADLISVPFQNNATLGQGRSGLLDISNGSLEDGFNFDTEQLEQLRRSVAPAGFGEFTARLTFKLLFPEGGA